MDNTPHTTVDPCNISNHPGRLVVDRQQLKDVLDAAEDAARRGIDVDVDEIDALVAAYHADALVSLTYGRGNATMAVEVVDYHWPEMKAQNKYGVVLDGYQANLLPHLLSGMHTDLNEAYLKGCTGAGKGKLAGILACLWFKAAYELQSVKVIVTSNTADHALKTMWGQEISPMFRRMRHAPLVKIGRQGLRGVGDSGVDEDLRVIEVINPQATEAFSGKHSSATLAIFDEATGCNELHWNQAETMCALRFALTNPRPGGSKYIRAAYPKSDPDTTRIVDIPGGRRLIATVGGQDLINVRSRETVIPNQMTAARYSAIKARRFPAWWADVMADGKFPNEDDARLLISPGWLARHYRAFDPFLSIEAYGLDVARSEHGDRTVLTGGSMSGIREPETIQTTNLMQVVGWVMQRAEKQKVDLLRKLCPVVVDCDGVGGGVADRLTELGVWVIEYHGNATSIVDPKIYSNMRAESYGELAARLDPDGKWADEPYGLPEDPEIEEDITTPEKIWDSGGYRFHITPKHDRSGSFGNQKTESLTKLLGRSPDVGDSIAYCYHGARESHRRRRHRDNRSSPLLVSGDTTHGELNLAELPEKIRAIVEMSRESRRDSDRQ